MSATAPTAAVPFSSRGPDEDPRDSRGRTNITNRVVTKVVAQVCKEVNSVHGLTPAGAKRVFGQDPAVSVEADIDGHLVQLRVVIAVDYPVSLRSVTRELRSHVRQRVGQLCELIVTDMNIRVGELLYSIEPVRRVL